MTAATQVLPLSLRAEATHDPGLLQPKFLDLVVFGHVVPNVP